MKKEIETNLTLEELEEIELEKEIIRTTIEIRKKKKMDLTQMELSKRSGIIQPSIAKIENFVRTPQYTTLMKLLYPMGYTLRVVPLEKVKDK